MVTAYQLIANEVQADRIERDGQIFDVVEVDYEHGVATVHNEITLEYIKLNEEELKKYTKI